MTLFDDGRSFRLGLMTTIGLPPAFLTMPSNKGMILTPTIFCGEMRMNISSSSSTTSGPVYMHVFVRESRWLAWVRIGRSESIDIHMRERERAPNKTNDATFLPISAKNSLLPTTPSLSSPSSLPQSIYSIICLQPFKDIGKPLKTPSPNLPVCALLTVIMQCYYHSDPDLAAHPTNFPHHTYTYRHTLNT